MTHMASPGILVEVVGSILQGVKIIFGVPHG